jgi:hypothetical protein
VRFGLGMMPTVEETGYLVLVASVKNGGDIQRINVWEVGELWVQVGRRVVVSSPSCGHCTLHNVLYPPFVIAYIIQIEAPIMVH